MGFLNPPGQTFSDIPAPDGALPDRAPVPPPAKEEKTYGGFLSDNPPPAPAPAPEKPLAWSDVPLRAAVNVGPSGYQYLKDTIQPIIHPIETAEGLGKIILGVAHKTGMYDGADYEKYADAVGEHFKERYGGIDNFKKTLADDPVGTLGDISTLFVGPGTMARLPGFAGKVGKIAKTVSTVTDPLNIPRTGLWAAQKTGAMSAGLTSGAGMRAIEEAGSAGYKGGIHGENFRAAQEGAHSPADLVDTAADAVRDIVKERGAVYNAQKGGINNNQTLSFNKINRAMVDAHRINKFHAEEIGKGTKELRDVLDNQILHWARLPKDPYHTPLGFDALKKSLNDLGEPLAQTPSQKAILAKYAMAVKQSILDQVPEYQKLMNSYQEFSDHVNELRRAFSLPEDTRRRSVDTAFRKLQSSLRKNVNTNFGWRETLLDILEEKAPGIKSSIAGHALSSPEPHGLARLIPGINADGVGNFVKHLLLSSPAIAGRGAHNVGRAAGITSKVFPQGTSESLRQIGRLEAMANEEEPYKPKRVYVGPLQERARGGAVNRALRLARKH